MFTGLIQSIGKVISIREAKGGRILRIHPVRPSVSYGVHTSRFIGTEVGESIAVNGVCLTVCKVIHNDFEVYAGTRTLSCTNLSKLAAGSKVNLERALKVGDRIGGHLVQGHVDGVAKVVRRVGTRYGVSLHLSFPQEYRKYLVQNGSIAIDGVSLTIASIKPTHFEVSLIPYTLENTTFGNSRVGNLVNFEVDIISKYLSA